LFLGDFLLKNPMHITGEQWRLIELNFPPPSLSLPSGDASLYFAKPNR
jgi:hypothetical protein